MTSTLVIFGASLMDAGNISHATDGLVLGEHMAQGFGADLREMTLINVVSSRTPKSSAIHNYAHGGAQSGKGPVTTVNGLERATGLTAQVQAFRRRAGFYRSQPDVDALVSAGANDVLDFIDEGLIDAALETRTRRDDRRLVRSAVQSISGNLIGNIDRLTGVVDEVAVLGALPLTSTPLVVSKAEQLNSRSAKTLKAMVNGVSRRVMRMLAREYRRQDSVAIIDAQPLWSKIANPGFIDPVHPSSQASGELAQLIVSKVSDRLPGFGFG